MTLRKCTRTNKTMPVGDLVDDTIAEIKRRAEKNKRLRGE